MQREFPSDFDPEIETSTFKKEDEEWFRNALREAGDTHIINIPSGLTLEESHKIAKEVKEEKAKEKIMRKFDTGATRDTDLNKLDYEGFFSPLVLKCCAEYLNEHRTQADGKLRDSDNWQQGIPIKVYMKSKWRHFMDTWMIFRGYGPVRDPKDSHIITMEEALCGEIFNASGHLHELLKEQLEPRKPQPETLPETVQDILA